MDIPLGSRPKSNRTPLLLFVLALVVAGVAGYVGMRTGAPPIVTLDAAQPAIGRETSVTVEVREPVRGLVDVTAVLVQGGQRTTLAEQSFMPQPAWSPWAPKTEDTTLPLLVGKDHQPSLEEGTAVIEVTASGASTWLSAGPQTVERLALDVMLTPPSVDVTAREIYVTQGGSEAVTYVVGPTSVRDGVQAGRWFFPGFPHPNGESNARVALFGVPYDMGSVDDVKLIAEDQVGNKTSVSFVDNFRPKPYDTDTIQVTMGIMRSVVPKIRERTPDLPDKGKLLHNYVYINSELRKANNAKLEELASKTQPRILWERPFVQMPAKVVSSFADRRTYLYEGKKIDQQDHLGFDLASVRHDEIPAANDGIVVMSEYLGIYGNTIVVDHGLGLMSLYAHCSSVLVQVGDRVTRGQTIAKTGATGLAIGDHLHFTMLMSGLPVTPIEWWDAHWIRDRIKRKLPGAFESGEE